MSPVNDKPFTEAMDRLVAEHVAKVEADVAEQFDQLFNLPADRFAGVDQLMVFDEGTMVVQPNRAARRGRPDPQRRRPWARP